MAISEKYDSIQCIAYNIGTNSKYDGYYALENDEEDWTSKCNVIEDAIKKAANSKSIDQNAKCMKVFMAPEFYFRGKKGAYDLETASKIVERLREKVSPKEYKDWLFVFGTIVAYSNGNNKNDYQAYNYSFIQKGNGTVKESFVVMKEEQSPIDFVNYTQNSKNILNDRNTSYLAPLYKLGKRDERKIKNYDSNAVFEIDGIHIGLEICLDNINRRIDCSNTVLDKLLDLQLIPGCGIGSIRKSFNLNKNGIAFLIDGMNGGFSSLIEANKEKVNLKSTEDHNIKSINPGKIFPSYDAKIHIYNTHNLKREISLNPLAKLNKLLNLVNVHTKNVIIKNLDIKNTNKQKNFKEF